jgi:hypothetical protein
LASASCFLNSSTFFATISLSLCFCSSSAFLRFAFSAVCLS